MLKWIPTVILSHRAQRLWSSWHSLTASLSRTRHRLMRCRHLCRRSYSAHMLGILRRVAVAAPVQRVEMMRQDQMRVQRRWQLWRRHEIACLQHAICTA